MRYLALACDYDGTIAHHGRLDEPTLKALKRVRESGRKLLLVTGRELEELKSICPDLPLFDRVVAENGALLYNPATNEVKLLAEAPPKEFVAKLHDRGVAPMSVGHAIVATWEPHESAVLDAIREAGLELQVIFNKGAVMVLPTGVNKASGLAAALEELGLSAHNVVGVGDAENDHAFLAVCEASAAVSNALDSLKERVDLVTRSDHGAGVAELVGMMVEDDFSDLESRLTRHHLLLGKDDRDEEVSLSPYGESLLVAGPSASGKSTVTTAILERMAEKGYQFCVIDPEGDYLKLKQAVHLGTTERAPVVDEVLEVLASPGRNLVVNLLGLRLDDRPAFFQELLPRFQSLRASTGRPHWLVIDEAHHLLPRRWEPASATLTQVLDPVMLITVHPDEVSADVLKTVDTVLAIGQTTEETITRFCNGVGEEPPTVPAMSVEKGQAVVWRRGGERPPFRVYVEPGKTERRRHGRKYAEGELPPDRSFYFTGPEGKLHLRAQNLFLFLQIGEGVDDETWLHHLRQGDYSSWLREMVKDDTLADEVAEVERDESLGAGESRQALREAVERHYTLPAASAGSGKYQSR
jgi:HAD superfamily hydrolase (TIGR01484 family)